MATYKITRCIACNVYARKNQSVAINKGWFNSIMTCKVGVLLIGLSIRHYILCICYTLKINFVGTAKDCFNSIMAG